MQPTQRLDVKAALTVGLELAVKAWKLALTDGRRANPAIHAVNAAQPMPRIDEVLQCIDAAKKKWGLPADYPVVVIYEAGQDGFWIARALQQRGVEVKVVDAASVPVSRQAKRAKTDRLDAILLVNALGAWLRGERGQLRIVQVPTPEAEARRHLTRERGELQKEIGQHRDRTRKLLRTLGCWDELEGDVGRKLASGQMHCADGSPLPQELRDRLVHECERLHLAQQQFTRLEKTLLQQLPQPVREMIAALAQLRGVGPVGAMRLVLELLWRDFRNRRQVGACVGLVAQPYDSGDSRSDQGISKQGNRRVRSLLVEMAWMWLRYQPDSAISRWFAQRTAVPGPNKRGKRIAIVAVARRLVIALWRYVKDGVMPEGAQLKSA
jgi:transposase